MAKPVYYIGVDPGVSGGIAVLRADDHTIEQLVPMPKTDRDVLVFFAEWVNPLPSVAMLERVHSSPQMGVVSAFTFGRGFGALCMALTATEIPFDYVRPQEWQRALGCLSKGDKNVTKARAQSLFPGITITHATADALLIAEFCYRFHHASETPSHGQTHQEDRPLVDRPRRHLPRS